MLGFITRIGFERKCVAELKETAGVPRKTASDFVLAYRGLIEEARSKKFNHISATAVACLYVLENRARINQSGPGFDGVQHVLVAWTYGIGYMKRSPMSLLAEEFMGHIIAMGKQAASDPDIQSMARSV